MIPGCPSCARALVKGARIVKRKVRKIAKAVKNAPDTGSLQLISLAVPGPQVLRHQKAAGEKYARPVALDGALRGCDMVGSPSLTSWARVGLGPKLLRVGRFRAKKGSNGGWFTSAAACKTRYATQVHAASTDRNVVVSHVFEVTCLKHSGEKYWLQALLLAVLIAIGSSGVRAAGQVSPNDAARFLAGLRPSSPSLSSVMDSGWQLHAKQINAAWATFERRQLTRISVWSAAKLKVHQSNMFYMFGGPDFLHANAFFPHAKTYVLSGLEPIGPPPNPLALPGQDLATSMASLRQSLSHFLEFGYFITRQMGTQFKAGKFSGTLPRLYVFLARSGKTIHRVEYVTLDGNGAAIPVRGKGKPTGVRITFSGRDGVKRILYYFRKNLENKGVAKNRFLKFCSRLGQGDSLVKSASYLLHLGNFSKVRNFLLNHSNVIIQDDSGIPLKYFKDQKWRLSPYGRYVGPIPIFKRHFQPDMEQLFSSGRARKINFGIGYRWYYQHTNILVAEKQGSAGRTGQ
jgi:hypothetical protein